MKRTTFHIRFIAALVICLIPVISCRKEDKSIIVRKEKLTGVVQIGPFIDASVSLYELSPTLVQTGKTFNTRITGTAGSFGFDNVDLSSQHVEMKANGNYFNEVTDSVSTYHISLMAISDVKDLSAVNINLLTHLEYERVKYLVEKGSNFTQAKDTAQKEVLSVFGFRSGGIDKSEQLDISVNKEENAILLAVSLILQGNRNVRDLTELLGCISADIRQDGKLDDETILQKLRSSTINLDLAKIRLNTENRFKEIGISASIPDFEKYIDIFLSHTGLIPSVETLAPINITTSEATIKGTVNANDLSSTVTFEYGKTLSYGDSIPGIPEVVTGHTISQVNTTLSGLDPGTTYHFRIKTVNSRGTVYGNDITFTTLGNNPTAITQGATNVSLFGATLNGTVNANDLLTTITFEYGTTDTYGSIIAATPGQATGNSVNTVIAVISGLNPGTIYHFRIKTVNLLGEIYGSDLTFTTLGNVPKAITRPATNISLEGAVLNGTVNANYFTTTVSFEYGKTESYGNTVSSVPAQATGSSDTNISCVLSGLTFGTIYHFRVKTVNDLGTVYGEDLTFATLGNVPTAVTLDAKNVTSSWATFIGIVNANDLSTTVTFEYGKTETYGSTVVSSNGPVSGHSDTNVSYTISTLTFGTIYHYRVKAVNALGTVYGSDRTFRTVGDVPTVTATDANPISGMSATLNGVVNANGLITYVMFQYGESTSYGTSIFANVSLWEVSNTLVSISIRGLVPETIYHFRIKAGNDAGITYGNDISFRTPPALVDVDGNTYQTVALGKLAWMTENLKTTKFNDNTPIPLVTDNAQWAGLSTPGYCWYNNDEIANKDVFGALYNFYVLDSLNNGGKNACPVGWHTPSSSEWLELIRYANDQSGGSLMEGGLSYWHYPSSNATGFTALPGEYRLTNGTFYSDKLTAYFLTSSYGPSSNPNWTYSVSLEQLRSPGVIVFNNNEKQTGGSVRCVMNKKTGT